MVIILLFFLFYSFVFAKWILSLQDKVNNSIVTIMNKHKSLFGIRSLMLVAMLCVTGSLVAQTTFRKGAYYNLFPATDGRLVLQLDGDKAKFQKMDTAAEGQYWTVTDLSGSVRIINPFTNQALRADGNKVGVGENNGSDEAQLWKVETFQGKMRGAVLLIPANRPEVAMCREQNGTLSLIPVTEARTKNAAAFRIDEAAEYGFDAMPPIASIPSVILAWCWVMATMVRTMQVS